MRPGLEGTGPAIDLGMAMGALNTGAASWMWDWEDAGGDYKDQLYQAWENLRDLLAHKWDGKPFVASHEQEAGRQAAAPVHDRPSAGQVADDFPPRPRTTPANRQIALDGEQVPAIIPGARHPRGEQLRLAEEKRIRHLLLRAQGRNVAGSAARRRRCCKESKRPWAWRGAR